MTSDRIIVFIKMLRVLVLACASAWRAWPLYHKTPLSRYQDLVLSATAFLSRYRIFLLEIFQHHSLFIACTFYFRVAWEEIWGRGDRAFEGAVFLLVKV